jgi:hypothetical protein
VLHGAVSEYSEYGALTVPLCCPRVELVRSNGRLLRAFDLTECDVSDREFRGVRRGHLLQLLLEQLPPGTVQYNAGIREVQLSPAAGECVWEGGGTWWEDVGGWGGVVVQGDGRGGWGGGGWGWDGGGGVGAGRSIWSVCLLPGMQLHGGWEDRVAAGSVVLVLSCCWPSISLLWSGCRHAPVPPGVRLTDAALLPVACCSLPAARCFLPAACCSLPAACCFLPAACCPAARSPLPAVPCLLPAACCSLPAACCSLLAPRCLPAGPSLVVLEDGRVLSPALLIGADGARSRVAAAVGLPPPNYAGYVAYR